MQDGEDCDPPMFDYCNNNCEFAVCGDGEVNQSSEQCDSPNPTVCDSFCQIPPPSTGGGGPGTG